jgi:hypothetical protein
MTRNVTAMHLDAFKALTPRAWRLLANATALARGNTGKRMLIVALIEFRPAYAFGRLSAGRIELRCATMLANVAAGAFVSAGRSKAFCGEPAGWPQERDTKNGHKRKSICWAKGSI